MAEQAAPRRLVLLRHGQTEFNATRRIQGQLDAALDDAGHAQARRAADVLAAEGPVAVWSSDLARARDTAAHLAARTGLEVRADARLREYHLGARQGMTHDEYAAAYPEEYQAFLGGNLESVPDGETQPQVRERMVAVLREAVASVGEGETVVAVSHGAAIRVGLSGLLSWPPDPARDLRALGNCSWCVLTERPRLGGFALEAYHRSLAETEDHRAGEDPDFARMAGGR